MTLIRFDHRGLLPHFWNDPHQVRSQGLVTNFVYPSADNSKNQKGRISNDEFSYNLFFKIVLYWCLDMIRHTIDTPLKHNKYSYDIPIPFCHHLYLSATFKQCFTESAGFHVVKMLNPDQIPTCYMCQKSFSRSNDPEI
jgi:hypothetical protein